MGADCIWMEGAMRPVETVLFGLVISVVFAAVLNAMTVFL
jgi:hypothetical protein